MMTHRSRPFRKSAGALRGAALLSVAWLATLSSAAPQAQAEDRTAAVSPDKALSAARLAEIQALETERVQLAVQHARTLINNPNASIEAIRHWTDTLGRTHVPLSMMIAIPGVGGPRVKGVALMAHVSADGAPSLDPFEPPRNTPRRLNVSEEQALALAQRPGDTLVGEPALILRARSFRLKEGTSHSVATDYALLWEIKATAPGQRIETITEVDTQSSVVVSRHQEVIVDSYTRQPNSITAPATTAAFGTPTPTPTRAPLPPLPGTGHSRYSGWVPMRTSSDGAGNFQLCDPLLGLDQENGLGTCAFYPDPGTGGGFRAYLKPQNTWGDGQALPYGGDPGGVTGETGAVDALWGVRWAWDLLRILDPLNGPMGTNHPITINLHGDLPESYNDLDKCTAFTYSDEPQVYFPGCSHGVPMQAPDIVGHEFFHLVYRSRLPWTGGRQWGEARATNEANSMIFGEMTEAYMRGFNPNLPNTIPNGVVDFIDGALLPSGSIDSRNLIKPSLTGGLDFVAPGTNPGDSGEQHAPHRVAGVLTRMFWFMAYGAPRYVPGNPNSEIYGSPFRPDGFAGLGRLTETTRIWFNAVPYFGNGWFVDVRAACLNSARQTYGWDAFLAVANAFAAVGVNDPNDQTPPTINMSVRQETNGGVKVEVTIPDPDFYFGYVVPPQPYHRDNVTGSQTRTFTYTARRFGTGDRTFRVIATDRAGNIATASVTITVDADPPIVTLADTTTGRTLRRTFLATAADVSGIKRVLFHVDGTYKTTLTAPPYEFTTHFGDPIYAEGEHRVEAVAIDRWNNEARVSTVLITDRSAGECVVDGDNVPFPDGGNVWFHHRDASGGTALFETWLDGGSPSSSEVAYDANQVATGRRRVQTTAGRHTLMLRCTDRWGNVATPAPYSFSVSARPTHTAAVRAEYEDIVVDYTADDDFGLREFFAQISNGGVYRRDEWTDSPRQKSGTMRLSNVGVGTFQVCAYALDIDRRGSVESCHTVTTTPRPGQPPPERCDGLVHPGGNVPEIHHIKLGKTSGNLTMYMQFYDVPDRIIVSYEGRVLWDTLCTSGSGTGPIGSYSGRSDILDVHVIPNCAGTISTAWEFKVFCP
jgi:Zn-dependent metalloprotease